MRVSATLLVLLTACAQGATVTPAPQQPQPKPQEPGEPADRRPLHDEELRVATRRKVTRYAFEAFPQWVMVHPKQACPDRLDELIEYVDYPPDAKDINDAWGRPMKMLCGSAWPSGVKAGVGVVGIGVLSTGADGKEGTADDIKSWE